LATALVLVATAVLVVSVQRQKLMESLDDSLRQRADDLTLLSQDRSPPPVLPSRDDVDTLAQIVRKDGFVLAASAVLANEAALADAPAGSNDRIRTVGGLRSVGQRRYLLLSRGINTATGPLVIHVAARLDDVEDSTSILGTSLAVAVPVVTLLLAVLVWWLVGRALGPVESIRAEVADISASLLNRRISPSGRNDEIARLGRTMNEMLDRLEDATTRQQRFVADASHELRSPLTRMRSELEVDLARIESADLEATHRSVLEETMELQRIVDDLLLLARSDAGVVRGGREAVDLDDIVVRQARRLRADGRVAVNISAVSAAQVQGDPGQLTMLVRNLAENAARHATSTVVFTLAEHDGAAVLTVADDGNGIPVEQQDRVFDRFTRMDDARSERDGGAGLGLAIARDIVERHGGSIGIDTDYRPGARFRVTLATAVTSSR
jgi:signal transduction histidine kinase